MNKSGYVTHEKDNLLFVRGKLPIGRVRPLMEEWALKGYTYSCNDLAKHYNCCFVAGGKAAINKARKAIKLPPI